MLFIGVLVVIVVLCLFSVMDREEGGLMALLLTTIVGMGVVALLVNPAGVLGIFGV